MVNQTHTNTSVSSDLGSPNASAKNIVSDTQISYRNQIDEVIGSLANAYENKRARQVVEWESLLRRNLSDPTRITFL